MDAPGVLQRDLHDHGGVRGDVLLHVNGHELFQNPLGYWVQASAGTTSKNDAFHHYAPSLLTDDVPETTRFLTYSSSRASHSGGINPVALIFANDRHEFFGRTASAGAGAGDAVEAWTETRAAYSSVLHSVTWSGST